MKLDLQFSESDQKFNLNFGQYQDLTDGGFERGYNSGYSIGYTEGETDGFDKGLEQGYNKGYAKAESENPLYYAKDMNFRFSSRAFSEERSNVVCRVFDCKEWNMAFGQLSGIKTLKIICDTPDLKVIWPALVRESADIELLDLTEFKAYPTTIAHFLYGANKLKTVLGALDLSRCTTVTNAFACNLLEDIEFVPNTIKISIQFHYCNKLTAKSIQSIFDGLATVETAQTLTLHSNLKILQSQVDSANAKGWTIAGGIVVSEEEYYG